MCEHTARRIRGPGRAGGGWSPPRLSRESRASAVPWPGPLRQGRAPGGLPAVSFVAQLTKDESHDAEAAVKSLRLILFGDGDTRVRDQEDGPGPPARVTPAALLVGFRAGRSADRDLVCPCRAAVRVARQRLGLICLPRLSSHSGMGKVV